MKYSLILEAYSLEQILELNDLTAEDALEFMYEERFVKKLPNPKPLEFD